MNYIPVSDKVERMLTVKGITAVLVAAATGGGLVMSVLGWIGFISSGPGQRMERVEARMKMIQDSTAATFRTHEGLISANRFYMGKVAESLRVEIRSVGELQAATTTKDCLDAEPSRIERNKLAMASVPCDSLYRLKNIRP